MDNQDWVECPPGRDGIELLQARFEHHVYERHMHDAYAIGVTLRGVQRFWYCGAHHDSSPGQVIVIRPGEVHDGRAGAAGGYAYRMFYVRPGMLKEFSDDTLRESADVVASGPLVSDRRVFDLLNAGWSAMSSSPSSLAADELLLLGMSSVMRRAYEPTRRSVNRSEPALTRVRSYLHENLHRPVTMTELASLASMSRFQLTRRFQQRYGIPVHGYFRFLRLEEARQRLAQGHEIAAVATDMGFVDQSHFHRRFRGSYGMTPGQWRAAHGYK